MKKEQQQTEETKNLTKPTEQKKEKNLHFSTSMD